MTRLWVAAFLVITTVAGTLSAGAAAPARGAEALRVMTLSNRADLISGGDALVEVVVPDGVEPGEVTVAVGRRDVTGAFAERGDGRFLGLIDGLRLGVNRVTATLPDGSGAYFDITNHPIGGPVFSGPQLEPWLCETEAVGLGPATDDDCNAPTLVEWFYMPSDGGGFQPYDPESPPNDVATTTTDEGKEVPYVVRRETGTVNRAIYRTAVLADPAQSVMPWAPSPWNHKLHYLYGGGAQPNWRQGSVIDDVLDDNALSRGFAVAAATSNINAQNTNTVTSAEASMMIKEHLVEQLGEIRYTLSRGGSGGSIQQQLIANAYPGVTDGILPDASFQDMFTTAGEGVDCALLNRYYDETSPHLWALERQQAAVNGQESIGPCREWDVVLNLDAAWLDPRIGCLAGTINPVPSLPEANWVYDAETNPTGARCTLQDLDVALFGTRPPEVWGPVEQQIGRGFANRPYDNVGVQYGLAALEAGTIVAEQFVDLNEHVGGWDIDYGWTPERSTADPFALEAAYRTGQMNDGTNLEAPIIDLRGQSNNEIHSSYHSWVMRARLDKANGDHDNQVIFTYPLGDSKSGLAFDLMDRWLSAIEADSSDAPLAQKVVTNKPEEAVDACFVGDQRITDEGQCRTIYPYYGSPSIAAGEPFIDDVLKCQLRSLDRADYNVEFSDEQWARLQEAFPDGVCDYSKPSVGEQPSLPWLTFLAADGSAIPGGQPLGHPPVSVPFGAGGEVCAGVPVASVVDRDGARQVHRPAVDCVIFTRISVGVAADRYGPSRPVTRGQMATFVVSTLRAAGATPPAGGGDAEFSDLGGSVHAESINRLARAGVVAGTGRNRFEPDAVVTRAQMASFVVGAAAAVGVDLAAGKSHFDDVGGPHAENINSGHEAGLFSGTDNGQFSPARDVLRDQMATFLINLLQLTYKGNG